MVTEVSRLRRQVANDEKQHELDCYAHSDATDKANAKHGERRRVSIHQVQRRMLGTSGRKFNERLGDFVPTEFGNACDNRIPCRVRTTLDAFSLRYRCNVEDRNQHSFCHTPTETEAKT